MLHLNLKRIKAERVAQGLTQEQLAKKINKKRIWYAKREGGYIPIGADDLCLVADALGVKNLSIFFANSVPEKEQIFDDDLIAEEL